MMLFKSLICLGAVRVAVAHTVFTTLYVDGVSQGDGTCVRMNQTPNQATYPVEDLSSNDMACGIQGSTGVSRVCAANQSSTLTFQFKEYPDGSQSGVIAASHVGPCAVYLKAVSSAIDDPGYGDGWFKIWESGYDEDAKEWCTSKLIANGGYLAVDIPSDLAGGYYLVRPELLALHNAADLGDPQFYTGCAQVWLDSGADAVPKDTVSIPGYVTKEDPSVTYNVYKTPLVLPYPIPGPAVYENGVASNVVGKRGAMVQTEGLKPEGCILESANWCAMELDTYSDMKGCWNASTACWNQDTPCWADAGPIGGNESCPILESYCKSIQNACNTSDFNGPPSAAKLQPKPVTISLDMVSPSGAATSLSSSAAPSVSDTIAAVSIVSSPAASSVSSSTTSIAAKAIISSRAAEPTTSVTTRVSSTSIVRVTVTRTVTVPPTPKVLVTDIVYQTVIDYITAGGGSMLVTLTPGSPVPFLPSTHIASAASSPASVNTKATSVTTSKAATTSSPVVKVSPTPASTPKAASIATTQKPASSAIKISSSAPAAGLPTTTFKVSPSPTSSKENTVTVTQSMCSRSTELSAKEKRQLVRRQAVHEVRKAFLEKRKE